MKAVILGLSLAISAIAQAKPVAIVVNGPDGNAMEDVVVYMQPLDGQQLEAVNQTVSIGQNNKAFTPYITVADKDNVVEFSNDDDITHHIYSAIGDNKFSFKIRAGQRLMKDDFVSTGVVPMGCNIHDWMAGYLLLLDNAVFSKTDAEGRALLTVPEVGKYKLVVWHPQLPLADNRYEHIIEHIPSDDVHLQLPVTLTAIPEQQNDEDFDFLSDY